MGFFYCDDSVQSLGAFVIGAFVYSPNDLTRKVFDALTCCGKIPGVDEYKSSLLMAGNDDNVKLRSKIKNMLWDVKVGLAVVPENKRSSLGNACLECLAKMITANSMENKNHEVYFDNGISASENAKRTFNNEFGSYCSLHFKQDSRQIGGIQVADLVAHSMGIMLLETLGKKTKYIKAGMNSGYDPELEIELGFALWASLRYSFFKADQPNGATPEDPAGTMEFDVERFGLHVAASCPAVLRDAVLCRFGRCYLGCIH